MPLNTFKSDEGISQPRGVSIEPFLSLFPFLLACLYLDLQHNYPRLSHKQPPGSWLMTMLQRRRPWLFPPKKTHNLTCNISLTTKLLRDILREVSLDFDIYLCVIQKPECSGFFFVKNLGEM